MCRFQERIKKEKNKINEKMEFTRWYNLLKMFEIFKCKCSEKRAVKFYHFSL